MLYWQAICNEFYNRYAKDYPFSYTTVRYYAIDEEKTIEKRKARRKYPFSADNRLYLTQREADCIYHMYLGLTIRATAQELLLSPRTVEFYLKRIKEKFHYKYKKDLLEYLGNSEYFPQFFEILDNEFNA